MPLYRTRENQKVDTFNLGQSPNSFGAVGQTKSQAETARDDYGVANASWLASYDADSALSIQLVYTENTENIVETQSRVSNAWAELTSVQAIKGQDGGTTELIGVQNNHIPVKSPSGESFEDSGVEILPDGTILTNNTLRTQNASIEVGNSDRLSEVGSLLSLNSNATGNRYIIPLHRFDTSLGSVGRPFVMVADAETVDDVIQPDFSTQLPDDPTFTIVSNRNMIVNRIKFKLASAVTNMVVRLKSINNGNKIVKYLPNEAEWRAVEQGIYGSNGYNLSAGDNTLDVTPSQMLLSNDPFQIDYEVDFMCASPIQLLGDGTLPYFVADGNYFTLTEMCLDNDLKEFFVYPKNGNAVEVGNWNVERISSSNDTHFIFKVPDNFNELVKCSVVVLPDSTETIQADVEVSISGIGLNYNDIENEVDNRQLAVSVNVLNEFDISDLMTGIDNTKYVAIDFNSDTNYIRVVGLNFTYK